MSTQFDNIHESYYHLLESPSAVIELEYVLSVVQLYLKGLRVLELACGSGCYTYPLLRLGAASVVAVDISSEQIKTAEDRKHSQDAVQFHISDWSMFYD